MTDDPGREHASAAAAGHEQSLGVDVAAPGHGIDARHQVVVVLVGIVMMNQIGKFLAIAGAAARVHVQHDVAGGCVQLDLRGKAGCIHGERSAVNLQNKGILFRRIKSRRLDDPALHAPVIRRGVEADFLERADGALAEQIFAQGLERRDIAHRCAGGQHGGSRGAGLGKREAAVRRDRK